MADQTTSKRLYDLLVTKNFDIQALDSKTGRAPANEQGQPDINEADEFRFDFTTESNKNYGSVVVLLGDDNDLTMFFGDTVGKTMEGADKKEWFDFLYQMKQFATKNFLTFSPKDITKLKYTKQGQAAIKEGLFESWQGRGDLSWNGATTEARLLIKHKKKLGESDARFRYIESIYVETAEGERFKLKSRSLTAGKAMLEHVRQGGNPYDARGQHINEIVEELSVLSRFRRANAGKILEGETKSLVEQTDSYYKNMHSVLKHLGTQRGYQSYFESWSPATVDAGNLVVEDLKNLFVTQTIDHRIEEALPLLARITQEANAMKEAKIFESWINNLVEGTWAIPETPEQKQTLVDLMSKEFPVGADAVNATEQLYDVFGDDELFDRLQELADADANADARSVILTRMEELADQSPDVEAVIGQLQTTNPAEPAADPDAMAQDVEGDEQLPQSVEEGIGGIGNKIKALYQKIYNAGDDEIEYFYQDSPIFAQYWDEYEGDLDSIIAEVDPGELQVMLDELESYVQQAGLAEGSHEDQIAKAAAYNQRMSSSTPPIDLGIREVGNWAKVGAYGYPIKSAWLNLAKYGVRNNRFNNSASKLMTAIGNFPDLDDDVYDMYDINQNEVDILYDAYETVYDQWEQLQGQQGVAEGTRERLSNLHDKIRKEKGLPDPNEYLKMIQQKKKEIADLKAEIEKEKSNKSGLTEDYVDEKKISR